MMSANSTKTEAPGLLLIDQVRAMLQNEAYHYCADCHAHCRQTILAVEATKEAAQAYSRLNSQHGKLVEAAQFALTTPGFIRGRNQLQAAVDATLNPKG